MFWEGGEVSRRIDGESEIGFSFSECRMGLVWSVGERIRVSGFRLIEDRYLWLYRIFCSIFDFFSSRTGM